MEIHVKTLIPICTLHSGFPLRIYHHLFYPHRNCKHMMVQVRSCIEYLMPAGAFSYLQPMKRNLVFLVGFKYDFTIIR